MPALIAFAPIALLASPARAVLDINDRGPVLDAGGFGMRVTNAGILGNAFYDKGISNDPSFEFPTHSGQELLNHAELWVGARTASGARRVSGGPLLEWRPTLAADDHVRMVTRSDLGTRRQYDDDGDGRVDEEQLNGRDDDGDGEIDEDLGLFSHVLAVSDYVDDRPEAINYVYPTGEPHVPLGLSVHQEAMAWSVSGDRSIAGYRFTITNHGSDTLHDLLVGLLADLDSRLLSDRTGHLNDRIQMVTYSRTFSNGFSVITNNGVPMCPSPPCAPRACVSTVSQTVPVLTDGVPTSGLPAITVLGLDHTIDELALIPPGKAFARAPGKVSFRYSIFSNTHSFGDGGVPTLDSDRYLALNGQVIEAVPDHPDDYQVLVSCGPFASLAPGQQIVFDAAFVAGQNLDSLKIAVQNALGIERGYTANFLPDSGSSNGTQFDIGETGLAGHEVCIEPPRGVSFYYEPHCVAVLTDESMGDPPPLSLYSAGHCVWTDADCDKCTGIRGNETIVRWLDPGDVPPTPGVRATPGDHRVRLEWDNLPEVLIKGGVSGVSGGTFVGYRVYRLADWRNRESLLPPSENWALLGAFGSDTTNGEIRLASITDTTLDYDRVLYEQKLYPPGRYSIVDSLVKNGFDYVYTVAAVYSQPLLRIDGSITQTRVESPLVATFDERVTPHKAAESRANGVWVVPNPFRANAAWDRPAVSGDALTRHLDFMGLPAALSTIRIYTVAGDFVAQIEHDGRRGDGEASWDLVSRNGQDVVSGIYLFTVTSPLGHQRGRFVVMR